MADLMTQERRFSKQVSELEEFDFAVIGGRPCRVIEVNKLGRNEWQIIGRDLFLGHRIDEVMETEEIVWEPCLVRKEYILANIMEKEYLLIDPHTDSVLRMPKSHGEVGVLVQDLFERDEGEVRVTVGKTPFEEGIVDYHLYEEEKEEELSKTQ